MLPLRIEDNLRPPIPADPYLRDVLSVALLLLLALVLIPSWDMTTQTLLATVATQMASGLLLLALGFLLALRCGAIDLSVWVVSGIGGIIAATLINHGVEVWVSFALAGLAGLAIGVLSGSLVSLVGLPSPVVTGVVAMLAVWVVGWLIPGRQISVAEQTFDAFLGHQTGVLALRVLTVSVIFLAAVVVLVGLDWAVWNGTHFPRRASLLAALAASGLLAALGGAVMLIDNGLAPVPTRIVDDLRVPAAALLAGGLFLGRRGRELLAGLSLPSALLLCTIWRQNVWNLPAPGYGLALQMLVLMGMVIAAHVAFGRFLQAQNADRQLAGLGVLAAILGILLTAGAANFREGAVRTVLHLVGLAVWLAGMPIIIISFRREHRLAKANLDDDDSPTVGRYEYEEPS